MKPGNRYAGQRLYGLGQAAEIIGCSELRVRNLSTVRAYHLAAIGTWAGPEGTGGRRLFEWHSVVRLAVANALFEFGFRPEEIGNAATKVTERHLSGAWAVFREFAGWRVGDAGLPAIDVQTGYFVLYLQPLTACLEARRDAADSQRKDKHHK